MTRTANPALHEDTFTTAHASMVKGEAMTLSGAVNKTLLLTGIVATTAAMSWQVVSTSEFGPLIVLGSMIAGFIVAMITIFKPTASPISAPLYAVLEGVVLGGISASFEAQYPGIVVQAIGGTIGTLGALLLAYKSGLIKPTENFKLGVVAATGGIALLYLGSFLLQLFGVSMPYLYDSSPLSIGISVIVVGIAALNLVLDFDFIEQGAERGLAKYMEWYAAFGLLVTLVWLYLEILRLIAKLRGRE